MYSRVVDKRVNDNWIAFINNGREQTNFKAEEWAKKLESDG